MDFVYGGNYSRSIDLNGDLHKKCFYFYAVSFRLLKKNDFVSMLCIAHHENE